MAAVGGIVLWDLWHTQLWQWLEGKCFLAWDQTVDANYSWVGYLKVVVWATLEQFEWGAADGSCCRDAQVKVLNAAILRQRELLKAQKSQSEVWPTVSAQGHVQQVKVHPGSVRTPESTKITATVICQVGLFILSGHSWNEIDIQCKCSGMEWFKNKQSVCELPSISTPSINRVTQRKTHTNVFFLNPTYL